MKSLRLILFAVVFTACSHQNVNESKRSVASIIVRRPMPISCQHAFDNAKASTSLDEVADAALACEKAAEATCIVIAQRQEAKTYDETHNLARTCAMNAAYGANKAANNGTATGDCKKAYSEAKGSPARGPMNDAISICDSARQTVCDRASAADKDGALNANNCALRAAYGSFQQVQTKPRTRKM